MRTMTALLAVFLIACGEPAEAPPAATAPSASAEPSSLVEVPEDQVLASVGGVPVTIAEFKSAASRKIPADGQTLSEAERAEVIDDLIAEKVLYLEAKRLGIDRDPKVQKAMVNTLLRRTIYSKVRNSDFTEEELRAYFDAHGDEFVVPEKRQIKRVFVRGDGERTMAEAIALAEEARSAILADPSEFKEIAGKFSEDPYRRRGGDVGFVSAEGKPGVPKAVVDKAFTLEQGSVSEVFEADGGANVIYIASIRDRIQRTFEQMRGGVLRKVKNDRLREMLESYVGQVKDGYPVERQEDRVMGVELETVGPAGPKLRLPNRPGDAAVDPTHGGH
ncbi:MAG: peptidyl-prolyl cis-trans isomerase [Proteobacteria bacterium]|nr:peptidyl-prolyl cis-trans isomerase [Pseudomonadota bacterium]